MLPGHRQQTPLPPARGAQTWPVPLPFSLLTHTHTHTHTAHSWPSHSSPHSQPPTGTLIPTHASPTHMLTPRPSYTPLALAHSMTHSSGAHTLGSPCPTAPSPAPRAPLPAQSQSVSSFSLSFRPCCGRESLSGTNSPKIALLAFLIKGEWVGSRGGGARCREGEAAGKLPEQESRSLRPGVPEQGSCRPACKLPAGCL